MKKGNEAGRTTITVTGCDPARLDAVTIYCREKGIDVNEALKATVDLLYARHVPPSVQRFLELQGAGALRKKDDGSGADK